MKFKRIRFIILTFKSFDIFLIEIINKKINNLSFGEVKLMIKNRLKIRFFERYNENL